MKKLMHFLASLFPASSNGDNAFAVALFHRMTVIKAFFKRKGLRSAAGWPVYPGSYEVIDPLEQIAVCTLTTTDFFPQKELPSHVAIIGTLITPNLGIEAMIRNIISNSHIRYLLLCGKDSPVFRAGQALDCLFRYGIDDEKRIIHALGHFPVLRNLDQEKIDRFLKQVQLINLLDEKNPATVRKRMEQLFVSKATYQSGENKITMTDTNDEFTEIKPGGNRVPLEYDTKGFFVITTDLVRKEITVKHYDAGNRPGFILHGHSGESLLLAILEKGLVSQLSHAGYLGSELAKAETSIRLGLAYQQDLPLRLS